MTNDFPDLAPCEVQLAPSDELLYRQITKHKWNEVQKVPASAAFGPPPTKEATMSEQSDRDALAKVLAGHQMIVTYEGQLAGCAWCRACRVLGEWTGVDTLSAVREHDVHTILASDWLAEHDRRVKAEALLVAAQYLRNQGAARMDSHGPCDLRGAALWDAGCAIDPGDGDALGARIEAGR